MGWLVFAKWEKASEILLKEHWSKIPIPGTQWSDFGGSCKTLYFTISCAVFLAGIILAKCSFPVPKKKKKIGGGGYFYSLVPIKGLIKGFFMPAFTLLHDWKLWFTYTWTDVICIDNPLANSIPSNINNYSIYSVWNMYF